MIRECSNGHAVDEDYLKACPRCGSQLPPTHVKAPPLAPTVNQRVSVPLAVPFVVSGVVLVLFGALLTYAAERGPAEVFGWLLLAAGVVVGGVGLADAVRRRSSSHVDHGSRRAR